MRASRSIPFRRALSRRLFLGTTAVGRDIPPRANGELRARDPQVPTWSEDAS